MKLLIDFFPIALFFVAFKLWGIYIATAVAIAATAVQIGYIRFKHGKVDSMQWLSLAIIVVFGGATLLLRDEHFIKYKPTALYWLMGGALLAGQWFFRKNLIRAAMGSQLALPEAVWRNLNLAWAGFFGAMGALNLWVAANFDTDTWVNFKLFGGLGLMLVFIVAQALYLSRHIEQEGTANTASKDAQP